MLSKLSYGSMPPAATLSDRAISMTTMSKSYGLPGIRIGWIAGPMGMVESVRAVREQLTICNSVIGEAIAFAALKQRDVLLNKSRERLRRNLKALNYWMAHQDMLESVEPEGGVVAFPRLKRDASTEPICRTLATKYRTFAIPGYGFETDRHLRIGFGEETDELSEGLKRLKQTLDEYAPKLRS